MDIWRSRKNLCMLEIQNAPRIKFREMGEKPHRPLGSFAMTHETKATSETSPRAMPGYERDGINLMSFFANHTPSNPGEQQAGATAVERKCSGEESGTH